MRILITGATGLIGQKLGAKLSEKGHELFVISRNAERAQRDLEFPARVFEGDLVRSKIEIAEEIDVVIHLLGESVAGRWTEARKKSIMDSRVMGTRNLIASLKFAPKMILGASAVGIYGDQKDRVLTEESSPGQDFLSQVCIHWEAELNRAREKFVQAKLISVRIGIVLATEGGILPKLLFPFRAGVGGPVGSGLQWMSWIHIEDLVNLLIFTVENKLSGVFNAVAPQPVTNSEFSLSLAKILNRYTAPKIPGFALKLMLGEMSQLILASQNVSNEKITKLGFDFKFKTLWSAFEDLVGGMKNNNGVFESQQFIPKKKIKYLNFSQKPKF